jgi:DnaJ family protein B protein 4
MGGDDMFSGFGGGGGGRGGRSRGGRMGGGMPGMGGGFGGGMPGGFGESAGASSAPPPPGEIVRPLALSLEELYAGGTKKLKITRHMRNGTQEERVLEVAYKPGWKKVCVIFEVVVCILIDREPKSSLPERVTRMSMDRASESILLI